MVIDLPVRSEWRHEQRGSWDVLRHDASSSELSIRAWVAEKVVNRNDCEAEARRFGSALPSVEDEFLLEERALGVPEGYDTALRAGVRASERAIEGVATAFGANVRKCLGVVFETQASGASSERVVAQRLRLVADGVLGRMRRWDIEGRVPQP
jgi:hypothetical protein